MTDESIVLETVIRVQVIPNKMKPPSTIANLPPEEMASAIVHNAATAEFRWMTGVDEVLFTETRVVKESDHELGESQKTNTGNSKKHAQQAESPKRPKARSRASKPKAKSRKVSPAKEFHERHFPTRKR